MRLEAESSGGRGRGLEAGVLRNPSLKKTRQTEQLSNHTSYCPTLPLPELSGKDTACISVSRLCVIFRAPENHSLCPDPN